MPAQRGACCVPASQNQVLYCKPRFGRWSLFGGGGGGLLWQADITCQHTSTHLYSTWQEWSQYACPLTPVAFSNHHSPILLCSPPGRLLPISSKLKTSLALLLPLIPRPVTWDPGIPRISVMFSLGGILTSWSQACDPSRHLTL